MREIDAVLRKLILNEVKDDKATLYFTSGPRSLMELRVDAKYARPGKL